MMQIQQGMQRLTNAAPGLLPGMGINPMGGTARPPPAPGNMPNNAYNMQHLMSQVSLVKACLISTGSNAKSHIFYPQSCKYPKMARRSRNTVDRMS